MALINSCRSKEPQLAFITSKVLAHFPSASALEYHEGKLFVFGDDAPYLLILDTGYRQLDTVQYLKDTGKRIAKQVKPDIEAASLITIKNEIYLCALGSFSTENRRELLAFPLANTHSFLRLDDAALFQDFKLLPEKNIEGFATVKSKLVLANRANTTHKTSKLVVVDNLLDQKTSSTETTIIDLVLKGKNGIGVSGLYYVAEKDLLLFTASEEDTPSATQDGAIHDSYLGWIKAFSKKMQSKTIHPDLLINLSDINKVFDKQKIESVCTEGIHNNEAILHLAADNDNGESRLFKMKLRFE
jgi:hypothetical protein